MRDSPNFAHALRLPYPPYLAFVVGASILIWLTIRVTYVIVLMVGVIFFAILPLEEGIAVAIQPVLTSRLAMVGLTPLLVWLDRTRSHELLLHHNLGASPIWFWIVPFFSASLLDFLAHGLIIPNLVPL